MCWLSVYNIHFKWRCQEFSFGGYSPGDLWMDVPGGGVQGQSPGKSGDIVPRSWGSLQTLFTDSDGRNDQNLKISHNSLVDFWPVCFAVGLSDIFGGLAPSPCLTPTLYTSSSHIVILACKKVPEMTFLCVEWDIKPYTFTLPYCHESNIGDGGGFFPSIDSYLNAPEALWPVC